VVTKDFIDIDGWVFPLSYVSKSLLVWLQASFIRWTQEDESERNREWIEGIAEAFQEGLAGKL
jgi:methionine salvage enolase-phosphatase E1